MASKVKQLKQKMTLDFANSSATKKEKAGTAGLLGSPDLNMLKLASPELERMIIAQNGEYRNCQAMRFCQFGFEFLQNTYVWLFVDTGS